MTGFSVPPRIQSGGTLGVLRNRSFCLYLFGLMVSLAGTSMQAVAEGWLVYQLTNSPLSLGLIGFVAMIPLVPWTLAAGALADRAPRRTILAIAQVGQIIPPLVLAVLIRSGRVQVWHVIWVNWVMGAMALLDYPARAALIADIVEPKDVDGAAALAASGLSVARVVGPAIGGVVTGAIGLEGAFVLNGLSFLAVLVALAFMHVSSQERPARQASLRSTLIEGGRYLIRERTILSLIVLMTVASFFVVPYQTLLPVFARDVLRVGVSGLGMLTTSAGFGAILGASCVTRLSRGRRGTVIVALMLVLSLFAAAFAFSGTFWLSCVMLTLVSGGVATLKILGITLVQVRTRDELRGRVSSVLSLTLGATPRLGGLVAGFLASRLGAPLALGLGALGCLLCGLSAWVGAPRIRELA